MSRWSKSPLWQTLSHRLASSRNRPCANSSARRTRANAWWPHLARSHSWPLRSCSSWTEASSNRSESTRPVWCCDWPVASHSSPRASTERRAPARTCAERTRPSLAANAGVHRARRSARIHRAASVGWNRPWTSSTRGVDERILCAWHLWPIRPRQLRGTWTFGWFRVRDSREVKASMSWLRTVRQALRLCCTFWSLGRLCCDSWPCRPQTSLVRFHRLRN